MKTKAKKFESVVQVGFIVIIASLLLLSVASNFVIYNVLENLRTQTGINLKQNAVYIDRFLKNNSLNSLPDSLVLEFKKTYDLSLLAVIPSCPSGNDEVSRKEWIGQSLSYIPIDKLPIITERLINAEFNTLSRSENEEYFYIYSFQHKVDTGIIILSKEISLLSYIDRSTKIILFISIVSFMVIIFLYLYLTRFIISPFNRLKKQAVDSGHYDDSGDDDVEEMIQGYKSIISDLQDKEEQLLQLNRDISKRADRLEDFNNYLLSSMLSGIVTIDMDGNIKTINESAEKILGIDSESYRGKNFNSLFGIETKVGQYIMCTDKSRINSPYTEVSYVKDNNEITTLGISISGIYDNDKNKVGSGIVFSDVSELVSLRKEVEAKKRMAVLGEMSSGLAHQLRNSMGAINGYANLVKKKFINKNMPIDSLTALMQESEEAESLIQRFLQYAKPFDVSLEKTAIHLFLTDIIGSFKNRDDCRQIEFSLKCDNKLQAELDQLLFKQTIVNLIENAINAYEGAAGLIELNISKKGNKIIFKVTDYAGGIEKSEIDKIFTPFYSSRPSGTGLGLPLASKIVNCHKGHISVESVFGQGTTFVISIPEGNAAQEIRLEQEKSLFR